MSETSNTRRPLSRIGLPLRAAVTLLLVWVLIRRLDFQALANSLRSIEWVWLSFALASTLIGKVISAYRWKTLLAAQDINVRVGKLVSTLFVGSFVNNLAPTTIGGDFYRAYDVGRAERGKYTSSLVTVAIDRAVGLMALVLVASIALLPATRMNAELQQLAAPLLLIVGLVVTGIAVALNRTVGAAAVGVAQFLGLPRLGMAILEAGRSAAAALRQWRTVAAALIISIVLQLNVVSQYFFISESLQLELPLLTCLLLVPIALLVIALPLSINGIGLRENVFVALLGMVGIRIADATALALIAFAMLLIHAAVGAVILSTRGIDPDLMRARLRRLWT